MVNILTAKENFWWIEMRQFKVWITTSKGFERFEFVLAENEEEVRCAIEETLKAGEKIKYITDA